jgi:predicted cupin superfamily sugar epimerase
VPTTDDLIAALGLERHPEGGWYRRTWTHPATDDDGRPLASSIHYLLEAGERSHWHRIDACEQWLWHGGGPLRLSVATGAGIDETVLGADVAAGQVLQVTVPPDVWQSAEPVGDHGHALVSCVVVPAFSFDHFELAPPGWSPTS